MDNSTKNKLKLMVFVAIIIIAMLVVIILNQVLPFNKKINANETNNIENTIEEEKYYTYLKTRTKFQLNIKQNQITSLNIEKKTTKIDNTQLITGMACIKRLNELLKTENDNEAILNILDDNFKNNEKISENIEKIKGDFTFIPFGANNLVSKNNIEVLIFYGYRVEGEEAKEYGYLVTMNEIKETYSVAPYDFEKLKNIINANTNNYTNQNIIQNSHNKLFFENDTPQNNCTLMLEIFKYNSKFIPELAYLELEKEYSNKFGSAKGLEVYISNNEEKLEKISVDTVEKKGTKGNTIYYCTDIKQNTFYIMPSEDNFFDFKIKFTNIIL